MKTASKGGQVEISITTFDKKDETIRFTSANGVIKVKELDKPARVIGEAEAIAWMSDMSRPGSGWGVTTELKTMPAWSV